MATHGNKPQLDAFVDALTRFVLDPTHWEQLTAELDRIDGGWQAEDPGELLAQLSRAETLSWQLKQDGSGLAGDGFAYVLLDDDDRVVGHSDNLPALGEYLTISSKRSLDFTDPASAASFQQARTRLRQAPNGHFLVELRLPRSPRQRYGYLLAAQQFPPSLSLVSRDAARALLIAGDQPADKLRQVIQASFSLTAAEAGVMLRIASGMTQKQIATELDVSVNTVRNHLQSIYGKSGVNRQGDLVLIVTQLSIILSATAADQSEGQAAGGSKSRAPVPPHHFMILGDERRIAYRTYGNPMDRPVLYLHEMIGSSRLLPTTAALAAELGLYIIAPERPGCGHSDPSNEFSFASVSADLLALLDHLRVQTCTVLGFLSGAAFALNLAQEHPDRVSRLFLVAGRPPGPLHGNFSFLATLREKMLARPWMLSTFFNILRNRASPETNGRLIRSVYGGVAHDRAFLDRHPEVFAHMVDCSMESMTLSAAGIISELQCFNARGSSNLGKFNVPMTVWHGSADRLASLEDLQAALSGKRFELRVFEDAGSLILLEHWEELLRSISAGADDR